MIDLSDARPQRPEDDYTRPALFDTKELKRQLGERAADWIPDHFPRGRISADRSEWRTANTQGDAPRGQGSCVLELKGEHAGCIRDWSTDEHGDQLYALECATGLTGRALFEYAAGLVGATPAKPRANGHDQPNGHGRSRRTDEDRARDIAFILKHGEPARGTLVETYLASRGLELPDCPDLLFHPNLTDWGEKRGRPGMVTILRRPDTNEPTAIHRTFLADDGSSKANMPKSKLTLGSPSGGVAMLMPMMTADGTLGIAEGQETALAAAKIFGVPVWSGISADGVRGFIFPPGLKKLLIFADRGEAGESAADTLCRRALAASINAWIYLPHGDDDFADDLTRGECRGEDYHGSRPADEQPRPNTAEVQPPHVEAEIIPPPRTEAELLAIAPTLTKESPELHQVLKACVALDPLAYRAANASQYPRTYPPPPPILWLPSVCHWHTSVVVV